MKVDLLLSRFKQDAPHRIDEELYAYAFLGHENEKYWRRRTVFSIEPNFLAVGSCVFKQHHYCTAVTN